MRDFLLDLKDASLLVKVSICWLVLLVVAVAVGCILNSAFLMFVFVVLLIAAFVGTVFAIVAVLDYFFDEYG